MTAAPLRTFTLAFATTSLAAVASGAYVAAQSGVGVAAWGLNLAAWLVGAALFAAAARLGGPLAAVVAVAALLALALTLVSPGLQGVHRWLPAGPLRLNAAELLAPALVVVLAATAWRSAWVWFAAAAALALLAAQPDASQATAVAAGLVTAICLSPASTALKAAGAAAAAAAAAGAWMRPDPLEPVAHVEDILWLAAALSPLALVISAGGLALASISPMIFGGGEAPTPVRRAALGLSAYFVAAAIAPLLGAFPTPLVGIGVSPIVGAWLGAGLLVARRARPPDGPAP